MLKSRIAIIAFLILISCNCQKRNKKTTVKDKVKNDYILSFLQEKNFNILNSTDTVIKFEIHKTLIEGTINEYSNKLKVVDTLNNQSVEELIGLLTRDESYNWAEGDKVVNFDPSHQFLLKGKNGRLNLLIDSSYQHMGFINLEGQKIVSLSKYFSLYLKEL